MDIPFKCEFLLLLQSPISFSCFDLLFISDIYSVISLFLVVAVCPPFARLARAGRCVRGRRMANGGTEKKRRDAATAATRCCWRRSKSAHRAIVAWHRQLNTLTLHLAETNKRNGIASNKTTVAERERSARVPTVVNHGRNARATTATKTNSIKTNRREREVNLIKHVGFRGFYVDKVRNTIDRTG